MHLSLISKGYLLMSAMCFYHIHLVSQNGQDLIAAKRRCRTAMEDSAMGNFDQLDEVTKYVPVHAQPISLACL